MIFWKQTALNALSCQHQCEVCDQWMWRFENHKQIVNNWHLPSAASSKHTNFSDSLRSVFIFLTNSIPETDKTLQNGSSAVAGTRGVQKTGDGDSDVSKSMNYHLCSLCHGSGHGRTKTLGAEKLKLYSSICSFEIHVAWKRRADQNLLRRNRPNRKSAHQVLDRNWILPSMFAPREAFISKVCKIQRKY